MNLRPASLFTPRSKSSSSVLVFRRDQLRIKQRRGTTVVLGGALAGVSLSDADRNAYAGFIPQPALLLSSSQALKAWVVPDAVKLASARHTVLLGDVVAEWALAQKQDCVVVGVIGDDNETSLLMAVAQGRRLTLVEERCLTGNPQTQGGSARVAFQDFLDRAASRYPGAVLQCCGLVNPEDPRWEFIGTKPFTQKRHRPAKERLGLSVNPLPAIVPACIVAATLGTAVYLGLPHYNGFLQARESFEREASVVAGGGDYAPAEVEVLNRRKTFLDMQGLDAPKYTRVGEFADVIGKALPQTARLLEMRVFVRPPVLTSSQTDKVDLTLTVMLPIDKTRTALDQVQPVLSSIATQRQWRTRVLPLGWREEKTREKGVTREWRIYMIEAFLPSPASENAERPQKS